jgi:hypothetical protein
LAAEFEDILSGIREKRFSGCVFNDFFFEEFFFFSAEPFEEILKIVKCMMQFLSLGIYWGVKRYLLG